MRKKRKMQIVEQLDLFVPPRQRPAWQQLARPIKQKITELLAKLLCEKRNVRAVSAKEDGDE